jgi:hypothetical protein
VAAANYVVDENAGRRGRRRRRLSVLNRSLTSVVQIAVVTADLDRTLTKWVEHYGVGPWDIYELGDSRLHDMTIDEEPADYRMRSAGARWGAIDIEVIQPLDDKSIYAQSLARHNGADHLHHVACATDDFDGTLTRFRERGMKSAMGGSLEELRFEYLDTFADIGFWIELTKVPDGAPMPPPDRTYPKAPTAATAAETPER